MSTASLPLGNYRHYKGQFYKLLHIAKHSETEESFAVYQQLYGDYGIWIRPLAMFHETVEWQGKKIRRFQYWENGTLTNEDLHV